MRLILIGPPGSGKGTQAKQLSERLSLAHVATGHILRDAVRQGTDEGRRAKPYLDAGQLVPDDLVNDIVARRFLDNHVESFIMDGYPRTVAQAESFERALTLARVHLDAVIFLRVDDLELIRRVTGRWNCPNPRCQATYHTQSHPPKEAGVCDFCGTPLIQRDDDREDTVRKRMKIFHQLYDGLVEFYRSRGLLVEIPGMGTIEGIYQNIIEALEKKGLSVHQSATK